MIATARTNDDFLSAGQVFFTKLPEPQSGAYAVVARLVEGERTLAVFCDQDVGNGTFEVVPVRVTGDRMDQELGMAAGDTLRCSWFVEWSPTAQGTHPPDAPAQEPPAGDGDPGAEDEAAGQNLVGEQDDEAATGNTNVKDETDSPDAGVAPMPSLTLQFWACPEDVDPAAEPADLEQSCAVETSERSFMLTLDSVTTGETITGNETWQMQELTAYIDIGPGATSAANCIWTWANGADQAPVTTTLEGGLLTVTLPHPETAVSCNWFIFPL